MNYPTMAKNAARFAQVAELLEIPVIASAHTKFGPIDESVSSKHYSGVTVFTEKRMFSMLDDRVRDHLQTLGGRRTVVLYGCEVHICIKQTAFDLLELGYTVFLVVDAVTSMKISDRNVGLAALNDIPGVRMTTFHQVVFDMIKTSEHP